MSYIRRAKRTRNFFSSLNQPFEDDRLSWETGGLLAYLATKPDGWQIRIGDLMKRDRGAGRDKLRRMLKEAEECGYIWRRKVRNENGTFDWVSDFYETPKENPCIIAFCKGLTIAWKSVDGSAVDGSAVDGSAVDGWPVDIVKTESVKTESVKTEHTPPRVSEVSEDDFNSQFPAKSEPPANGQESMPTDPLEAVIYAQAKYNERKAQDPNGIPAYLWFIHYYQHLGKEYLAQVDVVENDYGFDGDHAWLAAAFLLITELPPVEIAGENKRARDTRKIWRDEFQMYLELYPVEQIISFMHYAVKEMREAGLTINSPRSISSSMNDVIRRINQRGRYVPKREKV